MPETREESIEMHNTTVNESAEFERESGQGWDRGLDTVQLLTNSHYSSLSYYSLLYSLLYSPTQPTTSTAAATLATLATLTAAPYGPPEPARAKLYYP